jgi:hypothetical protein
MSSTCRNGRSLSRSTASAIVSPSELLDVTLDENNVVHVKRYDFPPVK